MSRTEQLQAMITAFIEVCENTGHKKEGIINSLADVFDEIDLIELGFEDYTQSDGNNCEQYCVFVIESDCCYNGTSLIAASGVEEANKYIADFKENDPENARDSKGYCPVDTHSLLENVYSKKKGFVLHGIRYSR